MTSLTCVIPTFNRSAYVRDCLTKLQKSGVPDLEIIVSDDGSTDNTKEVVATSNPNAKYLWQPNSGTPSTARNAGFGISSGKYVAFLDCDDAWLPEIPAKAVELLERHPEVDVLFADARMGNPQEGYRSWIVEAGQQAFFDLPHQEHKPGFRILDRLPLFRRIAVRNPIFIGSTIMRREAYTNSGGFNPKLRGAADWDLWLRMASKMTFGFLNEPLAYYTRHQENMSSNQDHMSLEFCEALNCALHNSTLSPSDRQIIRNQLKHHLFGYAYLAYDRDDFKEAKLRFIKAFRDGDKRLLTTMMIFFCFLPDWLVSKLRRIIQETNAYLHK